MWRNVKFIYFSALSYKIKLINDQNLTNVSYICTEFRIQDMKLLLLTVGLLALAVVLLGVKVFFVKGGKFPDTHAHSSPELRRRGVGCAASDRD